MDLALEQIKRIEANANQFLERKGGESPWMLREELGKVMWERAGIVRDATKLNRALTEVAALGRRAKEASIGGGRQFNLTWQQCLDLRNLLLGSELIARSALLRQESRGAHYREDFPNADDTNWLRNIYMKQDSTGPKTWSEPVKFSKLQPKSDLERGLQAAET